MTDAVLTPPPTTQALVRLRWLVEQAEALARDRSDPGRHLAVIALDGAVEYALWLVVNATGAPVRGDRPNWAELVNAVDARLDALGRTWGQTGRAGIDQLRRARNPAQHAGVSVDADQLADWAQAARAYVDDLLGAAFDLGLADLHLALAVDDLELRERLTRADVALDAGEAEIAFSLAWIAFELALGRWHETRHGVAVRVLDAPHQVFPSTDAAVQERLADLERLLDVSPFAADLGEYVALARSRVEQETTGWTPEETHALRALRFSVAWIVRWEVFARGYPSERWEAFREAVEPPSRGGERPQLTDVSAYAVRTATGNPRWLLRAQVADVPERGRGDWGVDLVQCFVDAAGEQERPELRAQRLAFTGRAGVLSIELDPDQDAVAVHAALRRAVELADQRYRARRADRATLERRRAAVAAAWTQLVSDAAAGQLTLRRVVIEARADGSHFVVELDVVDGTDIDRLGAAELLRSHGGWLAGAGVVGETIAVEASDDADDERLRVGLAATATELRRRRAEASERSRRFERFAEHLASLG